MSSVQELSSGMLVCDFSCLFRKIASYKKNPFFSPSFFQHRLMKKLSDSVANVIMGGGGGYVSSFMMILWWLYLLLIYFLCHTLYNMSNKWLQALFFCGGWSVGSVTKSSPLWSALCPWCFVLFHLPFAFPSHVQSLPKTSFYIPALINLCQCMVIARSEGSGTLEEFPASICPVLLQLWFQVPDWILH